MDWGKKSKGRRRAMPGRGRKQKGYRERCRGKGCRERSCGICPLRWKNICGNVRFLLWGIISGSAAFGASFCAAGPGRETDRDTCVILIVADDPGTDCGNRKVPDEILQRFYNTGITDLRILMYDGNSDREDKGDEEK